MLERRLFLLTLLVGLPMQGLAAPAWARGGNDGDDDDDDDDDDSGSGGGGDDRGDDDDDDVDDKSGPGGGGSDDDDDHDHRSDSRRASDRPDSLPRLPEGVIRLSRDGSREQIRRGQYQRSNARGQLVEHRAATATDRNRLTRRVDSGFAALIDIRPGKITITDSAGWREEFGARRYRLFDPRGNIVSRRPLTTEDTARLRQMIPR
ncbi:hypothetical protein [Gemmobacter caeruleus]|uniref:hypothetical protein n=1 Tax=Gemmobacter caeruleus TaxID=2595004 RepID=UPI0011EF5655|nr:hypothetical protein [Gemmobacter caeruleus]